jgi:hypothetical protein
MKYLAYVRTTISRDFVCEIVCVLSLVDLGGYRRLHKDVSLLYTLFIESHIIFLLLYRAFVNNVRYFHQIMHYLLDI